MKRYLSITLILACLLIPVVLVVARGAPVGKTVAVHADLRMEIRNDGQLTEQKMLIDLDIFDYAGKIYVIWNDVFIQPYHESKSVILKPEHLSTLEGSIKNVIANNDRFSFTIDLSGEFLGAGRTMQVVGSKRKIGLGYDVEATGLWWSDILNKKLKIEWRSTDKKFMLPYIEVF